MSRGGALGDRARASTSTTFSRERIDASVAELVEERDAVRALGLI